MEKIDRSLGCLIPLLITTIILAIVENLSFFGYPVKEVWVFSVVIGLIASLTFVVYFNIEIDYYIFIIFVVVFLHYIFPSIGSIDSILLVDAGDSNQYIGMGSWLSDHSIREPANLGDKWNTIQHNVLDHQLHKLRLGSIYLLSFVSAMTNKEVVQIYTMTIGAFLGLQALSIYSLSRIILYKKSNCYAAIIAILYGVSPAATWPAYASFVPQTLGLASAIALFCVWKYFTDNFSGNKLYYNMPEIYYICIFMFGVYAIYPEIIPYIFCMMALYSVSMTSWSVRSYYKIFNFLTVVFCLILSSIILSPSVFFWSIEGLYIQLGAIPHGGEQISSLYRILSTMSMSTQLPLIQDVINSIANILNYVGFILSSVIFIGFGITLFNNRLRILSLSVALSSIFLVLAVRYKYRFEAYGQYPLWRSLYSWNLFKAAQYVSPFVSSIGISGLFLYASSLKIKWKRYMSVFLISMLSLIVSHGQDVQINKRLFNDKLSSEEIKFFKNLPIDGRYLVDFQIKDCYTRYGIYSIMQNFSFISTNDWVPEALQPNFSEVEYKKSFLLNPIDYILTDKIRSQYLEFNVKSVYGEYYLVDVRGKNFDFSVVGNGYPIVKMRSVEGHLKVLDGS